MNTEAIFLQDLKIFTRIKHFYCAEIKFDHKPIEKLIILASSKQDANKKREEYINYHCDNLEPISNPYLTVFQGFLQASKTGGEYYIVNKEYLVEADNIQLAILAMNNILCNNQEYELQNVELAKSIFNVIL